MISGRIQSREYQKKIDEYTVETKTAYEISVNKISVNASEINTKSFLETVRFEEATEPQNTNK